MSLPYCLINLLSSMSYCLSILLPFYLTDPAFQPTILLIYHLAIMQSCGLTVLPSPTLAILQSHRPLLLQSQLAAPNSVYMTDEIVLDEIVLNEANSRPPQTHRRSFTSFTI